MLLSPATVRSVAKEIASAADGVIEDYNREQMVDEPEITGRLLGAISDRLRTKTIRGIVWNANILRSGRGGANEEQRYGADFMGVLDISLPKFTVKKGFLAQAKRVEPDRKLTDNDWQRLISQCKKMLTVTPDSFVVTYSKNRGVGFVPAIEVLGTSDRDLFAHYRRGIRSFFELFIECFVGDGKLYAADIKVLDALREHAVSQVLELTARKQG